MVRNLTLLKIHLQSFIVKSITAKFSAATGSNNNNKINQRDGSVRDREQRWLHYKNKAKQHKHRGKGYVLNTIFLPL